MIGNYCFIVDFDYTELKRSWRDIYSALNQGMVCKATIMNPPSFFDIQSAFKDELAVYHVILDPGGEDPVLDLIASSEDEFPHQSD